MTILSPCLLNSIGSGEIMISGVPFVPHLRRTLLRGFHLASPALPASVSEEPPLNIGNAAGSLMIVDQTRNRPSALAFAAATSPSIFALATRCPAFPAGKYGAPDPNVNSLPLGSSTLRARISGRLRIDGEPAIVKRSPT